jgi:hypothetical protein
LRLLLGLELEEVTGLTLGEVALLDEDAEFAEDDPDLTADVVFVDDVVWDSVTGQMVV